MVYLSFSDCVESAVSDRTCVQTVDYEQAYVWTPWTFSLCHHLYA